MKKEAYKRVLYSMNIVDKSMPNNPEQNLDINSLNYIKIELENKALTFENSMTHSFNNFKEEILNIVSSLKDKVAYLSSQVSVLSKEVDIIKFVGSIAIGIIITGFSFLYNQINTVRVELKAEMNTKFDKIDQKFDKIDQKFDKLYDLILKKK